MPERLTPKEIIAMIVFILVAFSIPGHFDFQEEQRHETQQRT